MAIMRNWSGTVEFRARTSATPDTVAAAQAACRAATRWKPIGTAHSFNPIADTVGTQVAMSGMDAIPALDEARSTVTVQAGITYANLAAWLQERGWALRNLASLPHISVGGAISTGTHGSGDRNGNLATSVLALTLLTGNGDMISLSRENDPDRFPGAVVSLGALGLILDVTLEIVPSFTVRQHVYRHMPWDSYTDFFDAVHGSAYSVCAFTDWSADGVSQVWRKAVDSDPDPGASFFGAYRADTDLHPIAGTDPIHCTPQCGAPGPWHLRLPHFLPGFTPSRGDEIQSEFFVPRDGVEDALDAVLLLGDRIRPVLWISEIRTVAADDLWMSPAYGRDVVGIHFTWKKDPAGVAQAVGWIEDALAPFGAVPHWGKVWNREGPQLPRFADFCKLVRDWDPDRRCRNPYVDRILDGVQ